MAFGISASTIAGGLAAGVGGSLVGGLLGGGGSRPSGSTQSTATSSPWAGVQPYLIGGTIANPDGTTANVTGIYPEAQRLYQNSEWSPLMQQNNQGFISNIQSRLSNPIYNDIPAGAEAILRGQYDPNVQRVANIAGADKINSQSVDPRTAFASMAQANPTNSISQMLSGQINTSTLDPVVNNAMRRLGESYGEQVMPAIRSGAEAAGQYGGSRQGIAEGLASRGLAYSMGDLADNLYNQAYQQAQQNMYGTANNMAGLGLSNAQGNANRDLAAQTANAQNQLATQQFNANLGLQNNSQSIANSQAIMNNRAQGMNFLNTGNSMQDHLYQTLQNVYNTPNGYNWGNLSNYSAVVQPGSAFKTTTTNNPYFTNPIGNALGLGLGGMQLYGMGQKNGLWGSDAGSGSTDMTGFYTPTSDLFGGENSAYGTGYDIGNWGFGG